ncbi:HlyD family secretion protein, partial [Arsenicitalea aurantiaca]
MKYVLRILGVVAILFSLYVIVGEQLVGSSGDAYVNAPLATIRAPINGTLQLSTAPLGGRVRAGDAMGSVSARAVADATLSGLEEGRLLA